MVSINHTCSTVLIQRRYIHISNMKFLIVSCLIAVASAGYVGNYGHQQPQQQQVGAVLGPNGVPFETAENLAARAAFDTAFQAASARAGPQGPGGYDGSSGNDGSGYSGSGYSGAGYSNAGASHAQPASWSQGGNDGSYAAPTPAPYRGPIHIPKIGPLGVPEEPQANIDARAYHAAAHAKVGGAGPSSGYSAQQHAAPAPASYAGPSSYAAPAPAQNFAPQSFAGQGYSGQGYSGQGYAGQPQQGHY